MARESSVVSLPAPVGGWNARDSIANMDPKDAVMLENWFPGTTSVQLRYGFSNHATGMTGEKIESLLVWNGPSSSAMFAATDAGYLYTVTTAGAVGAANVTGLTNGRWQAVNVSTSAGNYLMAVNGADKAIVYSGSFNRDGDGAPYNITGVDSATCTQINLHKNRVWLIEQNSLSAWYLPTGAIGGAATEFALNGVARLGGYLLAMATWTMDAGYGVDDMAVFLTSEGEIIVYAGTDPASAATWQLVGNWEVGAPIGTRCFTKFAGDVLVITRDGVAPLSGLLQSSRTTPRVQLSDKIQNAVADAVANWNASFGWELVAFPAQNQLYLNVPANSGADCEQYVMNVITKNWCKFTGYQAYCWAVFNDELYFGSDAVVCQAWDTNADNSADITGTAIQAFNYFGKMSAQKQFTMIRPTLFVNGTVDAWGGVNTDFDTQDTSATLQSITPNAARWDSAVWDTDLWVSDLVPVRVWQGARGIGYNAAPRLKCTVNGERVQWVATDIVFREGAIL